MNTIEIYCKGNKRNREGKITSACAHLIKEGSSYEEDAYLIELDGNGIKLELAALMNALLDLEAAERLGQEKELILYVHNEYIYKTLKMKEGLEPYPKEEKYTEEWDAINELLSQCKRYKVRGLEKKYREEENEEVVKCMAHLNRLVCDKVNKG